MRLQVFADVDACRKEVRHQDDPLGTLGQTAAARAVNGGLRQFQERGLDDGVTARLFQLFGERVQIRIRRRVPASVSNENQRRRHGWAASEGSRGTSANENKISTGGGGIGPAVGGWVA